MKRTTMAELQCARCEDKWFVCHQHPERSFPHDNCFGPGISCPECQHRETLPALPYWESRNRQKLDD